MGHITYPNSSAGCSHASCGSHPNPRVFLEFNFKFILQIVHEMHEICLWSSPRETWTLFSESFMPEGYIDKYHVLELGKALNPELEYMI